MPINSACNCCSEPPSAYVYLDFVSVTQSCNSSICGELPCTSSRDLGSVPQHDYSSTTYYEDTENIQTITYRDGGEEGTVVATEQYDNATGAVGTLYDGDGNCITTEQVCSPNWADLTRSEKCAARRYLTITEVDRSGGGNHGRTRVRQYTTDADANCTLETTCSGSRSETTVETGTFPTQSGETPACSNEVRSGGSETTTTVTITWNNDCTTSTAVECSGDSDTFFSCTPVGGGETSSSTCISSYGKIDGECQWTGEYDGTDDWGEPAQIPTNENCLNISATWNDKTFDSTFTIAPSRSCKITTTYTEANEQGFCTPKTLPSFPDFLPFGGVAQCEQPPETPELQEGQNQYGVIASPPDAYNFTNPYNPLITSKLHLKYQVFQLYPSHTCYTKVWFRNKVQKYKYEDCDSGFAGDPPRTAALTTIDCNPDQCFNRWSTDGEPTFVETGTYIWQGSGYPCYAEKTKSFADCENIIYGEEKTVVPDANTSVTVEYKYSFVEGYEPDWGNENGCQGCKPNGYPIPNPDDCPVCAP